MMGTGNVAMIHRSLAYLVNDPLARCGAPSTPNDASAAIARLRGAGTKWRRLSFMVVLTGLFVAWLTAEQLNADFLFKAVKHFCLTGALPVKPGIYRIYLCHVSPSNPPTRKSKRWLFKTKLASPLLLQHPQLHNRYNRWVLELQSFVSLRPLK